ncbi:SLC13 family permease [Microbacterium petrolearium]
MGRGRIARVRRARPARDVTRRLRAARHDRRLAAGHARSRVERAAVHRSPHRERRRDPAVPRHLRALRLPLRGHPDDGPRRGVQRDRRRGRRGLAPRGQHDGRCAGHRRRRVRVRTRAHHDRAAPSWRPRAPARRAAPARGLRRGGVDLPERHGPARGHARLRRLVAFPPHRRGAGSLVAGRRAARALARRLARVAVVGGARGRGRRDHRLRRAAGVARAGHARLRRTGPPAPHRGGNQDAGLARHPPRARGLDRTGSRPGDRPGASLRRRGGRRDPRGARRVGARARVLLVLWIFGSSISDAVNGALGTGIQLDATTAAFVGIAVMLVTRVLTWKDMARNGSAWNTFIFFAVLVGMAEHLNRLGVIQWIGDFVSGLVGGMPWVFAFAILTLVYFYAHYLFASNTAQIVAMYGVFLGAAVAAGAPPMFAALVFGFIGNLFGALSHYASGPSGVIYGSGYVKVGEWFRTAFVMSVVVILIWTIAGGAWMAVLGLWEGAAPPLG